VTPEQVRLIIANADTIDWTVYGLVVRRNGSRNFIDPQLTWPKFKAIATALGFECNEFVKEAYRG
jgi:hypothetical protein